MDALDRFLYIALLTLELVSVPTEEEKLESQIRDLNDRTILRAAISAKVDVLLTGDKDFLESGIKTPMILTPSDFLKLF
jgi:predicted nucleic acid-binding protein